jgi:hypothetical protein
MSGNMLAFGNSYIAYTGDFRVYSYQNGDVFTYNFLLIVMLLDKLGMSLDKCR